MQFYKAPVEDISINNLNIDAEKLIKNKKDKFNYIIKIADFYYEDTAKLLIKRIESENNLIEIFREAYNKGIILSGVSAGAICWFDWILSDSEGIGLKALRGINLISGSCTPHSSENERLKKFKNDIQNSEMPKGIAIDDGVGVLFIDGKPSEVYSSRKNHDAYFIDKNKKISLKEHIKNSL